MLTRRAVIQYEVLELDGDSPEPPVTAKGELPLGQIEWQDGRELFRQAFREVRVADAIKKLGLPKMPQALAANGQPWQPGKGPVYIRLAKSSALRWWVTGDGGTLILGGTSAKAAAGADDDAGTRHDAPDEYSQEYRARTQEPQRPPSRKSPRR